MARRYDTRTTIFSPEGLLYQVTYAMKAIGHAGSAIGILATDGIILAAEKKNTSVLLDKQEKMAKTYRVDNHLAVAVAGITADANILVNHARLCAQRHTYQYKEPVSIEYLVQQVADLKQGYTQYGGLRPFGVSFLFAGWDKHHSFQLYHSDPSGNYGGWKATAIGNNSQAAQSMLKQEYKVDINVQDALILAIKVLSKTMDSTELTHEKLEFSKLQLSEDGEPIFTILGAEEIDQLVKDAALDQVSIDDDMA
eukprot:TRINITY_DN38_c0_g1_i1.p1 TRINITY_DN38_c0_g1~~TRINITY_DN38_c0_g1_i1.p1  ORF type:complete len:253 (-),score=85.43 TRINITY_DN38_c0_g1_i1:129-887(-)